MTTTPRPERQFTTTRSYGSRQYGPLLTDRSYGKSRSYLELAGELDLPKEPRRGPAPTTHLAV